MLGKIQKFGAAMLVPVMLMPFAGIVIGLASIFTNPDMMGGIFGVSGLWYDLWNIVLQGSWAVFNQMPILFAISLPLGLANKAHGRAAMASFVTYMSFNYFVEAILNLWGQKFGVDMSAEVGGTSGLTLIAGIKTLDMSIIGALLVAGIVVWIHNKYYDKKLPDAIGVFQGSALVVIIGFVLMLPLAFLTSWLWPMVQHMINSMQGFLASSGTLGVGLFTFLERILIPTGLHHFIWTPFDYGPAVVPDGTLAHWMNNLSEYSSSTQPVKSLFPEGGFGLYGNTTVFGIAGIALAIYATAKPEKKKITASLLIPAALTSMLTGISEPIEFTFLFVSPLLFFIHSIFSALMSTAMYAAGVVGYQGGGLLDYITYNWIPMLSNHSGMVITHILIGLAFTVLYFFVFRFLILKMDISTPGREKMATEETKLYSKADYKAKKGESKSTPAPQGSENKQKAEYFLDMLGGRDNIEDVTNCATRLRVTVVDPSLMKPDEQFRSAGAHGVVRKGKAVQVIVGLSVPQVRDEFEELL
ncbi:PTS system maltose-specific EIICB component [Neobacillus rhizosphaerae]|uniref:PTS system maltose-specific EIICB component n=1 Tax=Neobacillus rhizosphaerae TaxID=2880965 RepID=A0ABM9EQ40_9BACI|nr:alpha-glucoside-specific PTS transporter subunit IIBC [Neobacillus rhizosphaerae]CAH2714746.1 PTS system maltose-specific EIICB component [Neobacillus rhizosphaerae]